MKKMTVNDLIHLAAEAYPDQGLLNAWDEEKKKPTYTHDSGDGLADFIVVELFETFDKKATNKVKLAEAIRVMTTARNEVDGVVVALERKQEELASKKRK